MATRDELLRMGGVAEGGDAARSSPSVEDLLKQGGTREEAPGALESFARGAGQGVSLGFGDELAGVSGAVGTGIGRGLRRLRDGQLLPDSLEAEIDALGRGYRKARDEVRAENADAERSNGGAYLAGQIGGGVASGVATAGIGHGLKGAVAVGAGEGAVSGFGGSGADLTKADVREYARAAGDTLKGGAYGATGAGVGYGIGQGVKAAGRWGKGVLDRARGSLRSGAEAAQELEEKAAAEAAQEAEVRMGKAHAQGLEMNAKLDRKKAQEAGRKAMQEARAARAAEAPTQADPRIRAQDAAEREADRAAGARTQVDQKLRAQDRENIRAARDAERQARQEAQAAQKQAEQLERAQGQALQKNKELDAARAKRAAKEARQAQKEAEARAMKAQRQAEALEKQHGVGLEMNKRADQRGPGTPRGGRPSPAENAAREQALDVDPDTKALDGYRRQAIGARLTNEQRIELYRQRLARGEGNPEQRELWEAYIEKFKDAVDRPHDYVRGLMEENMRIGKRKHPPEVVKRVMERIGPKGEILPRPKPAPVAQEITEEAAENPALLRQRERGFGSQNMGAARMGQETVAMPNAHIRGAQAAGGDPFHDAPTRVGLVRTSPDEGLVPGMNYHSFEFGTPGGGRFEVVAAEVEPGVVHIESVMPAGAETVQGAAEDAVGTLGAQGVRDLHRELARAFPGARRITGHRSTGANPGRFVDRPAPEVTQRMDASDLEAIAAKSENPALRRQREKGFGSQNMGAARFGEETIAFPNDDILRAQANRGGEATQVGPGPVTQAAAQAEARGGQDLRQAFVRGAAGKDAAALGLGGIAVGGLAGGAGGVAARGGAEVVKELARNPAARARAVTAFRLERLAETRPELYAKVGGALARALEKGPDHYATKRHVLLLTNPDLRQAEAEADAELQGLSDEELAARVARTR